jgi:hypothetical protein
MRLVRIDGAQVSGTPLSRAYLRLDDYGRLHCILTENRSREVLVVLPHMGLTDPRAHMRLAAIVRKQIIDGKLRPGGPALSITFLSQEHGHARPTCSRAMRILEDEGLLTRIPGLGYYVNHG